MEKLGHEEVGNFVGDCGLGGVSVLEGKEEGEVNLRMDNLRDLDQVHRRKMQ